MGTISRGTKAGGGTNFNSGQIIDPAEVNTDLNTVFAEANGALDDANIKTATIPGAKSLRFTEITTPSTPSSDQALLYAVDKSSNTRLGYLDSTGVETYLNRFIVAASLGESTTATGAAADIVSFTGLSIPKNAVIYVEFAARKTAGAASAPLLGLKVNGTQVVTNFACFSAANQIEYGFGYRGTRSVGGFSVLPHNATYLRTVDCLFFNQTTATNMTPANRGGDADVADATVTSVTLTGSSVSALITLAVKDVVLTVCGI